MSSASYMLSSDFIVSKRNHNLRFKPQYLREVLKTFMTMRLLLYEVDGHNKFSHQINTNYPNQCN